MTSYTTFGKQLREVGSVERFTISIKQDHIDEGLPGGSVSCPLVLALREAGYRHPVVKDYEFTFMTEDGREWLAQIPSTLAAWQQHARLRPDVVKPVTVLVSASELVPTADSGELWEVDDD